MATKFSRIAIPKTSLPSDNKIIIRWMHPAGPYAGEWVEYSINDQTLEQYETAEELEAAIDLFTQYNFEYEIPDIWFHRYDDGTWAIATGNEPNEWPENET